MKVFLVMIYDNEGFDFIWNEDEYPLTKIHYTTTDLVNLIYHQMNNESSAGVSCELGWVYTICQNHPHLGLKLYDIVRNSQTNASRISSKWKEFLINYALKDIPFYKTVDILKYYINDRHIFGDEKNKHWTPSKNQSLPGYFLDAGRLFYY
ncbi:hypothetical protein I4U23_006152 [Adineta vaga]|nr:hypothetical protein I4U23_006152 [Adineta vaga]